MNKVTGLGGSWSESGWNNIHTQGGNLEVVDYANFGKVFKFTIVDPGTDAVPDRIYMDQFTDRVIQGPCSIELPIFLSRDYRPARGADFTWANLLSLFNGSPRSDNTSAYSLVGAVNIGPDLIPYIIAHKPFSGDWYATYPSSKMLVPEKWYVVKLSFDLNYQVHLFIDGKEVASGAMDPRSRSGVEGFHSGAYGVGLSPGSYILNGPATLKCY